MTTKQILFSFQGRIDRETFAKYYLGIPTLVYIFAAVVDVLLGANREFEIGCFLVFLLLYLWPMLALQSKRWHDRDKSAWWILITIIPLIGNLWVLIELCGQKGTEGENRFGPDPKKSTLQMSTPAAPNTHSRTQQNINTPSGNPHHTLASRLAESKKLHEDGMLSADEYAHMRQKILSEAAVL